MTVTIASLVCLACARTFLHLWWGGPTETARAAATQCPACEHLYVRVTGRLPWRLSW